MAKFVMLTTLTDEGNKTLRDRPERLREVNREVEAMGAKVLVQYALLGRLTISSTSSRLGATKTSRASPWPWERAARCRL